METMPTGKLTWFDFAIKDETKALPFYKSLLAWDFEPMGPNYWLIKVDNQTVGGLRKDPTFKAAAGFTPYFNVPSITEAKGLVTKLGGKTVDETTPIDGGKMGYFQNFTDLDGNTLSLFSMKN